MATFIGTSGSDTLNGSLNADNLFRFGVTDLQATDTVTGSASGTQDYLEFLSAGQIASAQFAGVTNVEYLLLNVGGNELVVTDAMIAQAVNGLEVVSNGGTNVVDASGTTLGVRLIGRAGDNTLTGGTGSDLLRDGTGANTLIGGSGNDVYYIDNSATTIVEQLNGGHDYVSTSVNFVLSDNIEQMYVYGSATEATGNELDNIIIAHASPNAMTIDAAGGNDTVYGTLQNDIIQGGAGRDRLIGNTGADQLFGGADSDELVYDGQDVIDGGTSADDYDVISPLNAGQVIDLTAPPGVTNIEVVDLRSGANSELVVNAAAVAAVTDAANELVVFGDADNTATLGSGWVLDPGSYTRPDPANGVPVAMVRYVQLGTGEQVFIQDGMSVDVQLVETPTIPEAHVSTNEDTTLNGASPTLITSAGVTLSYALVTGPANGALAAGVNATTGAYTYIPDADFNGQDSFVVRVTASDGRVADATVRVTIDPENDLPVVDGITPNPLETEEDVPLLIALSVSDADGDTPVISAATARHGDVEVLGGTSLQYTPDSNFVGTETITVLVSDGKGGTTVQTLTVTVGAGPNQAPTVAGLQVTTGEDKTLAGQLPTPVDPDGDAVTFVATSGTSTGGGTFTINANGTFSYTPAANYSGTDTFRFSVNDGTDTTTATVTVRVNAINDAPVATADTATVVEDSASNIINVIANDTDADGTTPTVIAAIARHGTVTIVGNQLVYTPDANFSGADRIQYAISDGQGGTSVANVVVTVTGANDAPVVSGATVNTLEDYPISGRMPTPKDGDGGTPSYVAGTTTTTEGTFVIDAQGNYTFTPAANFNGTASFTVTVDDGSGAPNATATATLSINVTPVNDNPTAANVNATATEGGAGVTINLGSALADVDGDTVSVAGAMAQHGTVTWVSQTLVYKPAADFSGNDTITYIVNDGNGGSAVATVTVAVSSANDDPVVAGLSISATEDVVLTGVLPAAIDADGDAVTYSGSGLSAEGGIVVVNANGTFSYTPAANFHGEDSFTFTVSDGNGGTDTATVVISVASVNDAPTATDGITATTQDNTSVNINLGLPGTDVDGDTVSVAGAIAANGLVFVDGNTLVYTPRPGFIGSDTITYLVSDGKGATDTATIAVTVAADADAPIFPVSTISIATNEDNAVTGQVPAAIDPDGDAITYSIASGDQPLNGTVTINPVTGQFTYTPNANSNGADSFTVTVSDGTLTDTLVVNVVVAPENDAPTFAGLVAPNNSTTATEGTPLVLTLAWSDVDLDAVTVVSATSVSGRVVNFSGNTLTYLPGEDLPLGTIGATDAIQVLASDGNGGFVSREIALTLVATDAAPENFVNATLAVSEGEANVLTIANLLTDDIDTDPADIVYTVTALPAQGTLSNLSTGPITVDDTFTQADILAGLIIYEHSGVEPTGPDSFTFTVSDGTTTLPPQNFFIGINNVNDAPVAIDTTFALPISEDSPTFSGIIGTPSLPINFATDVDSTLNPGSFTFTGATIGGVPVATLADAGISYNPATGEFAISPQNVAAYQALDSGETANVVVSFSVSDGDKSDTGAVTFTVTGANDGPVITSLPQVGAVVEDEVPTGATAIGQVTATDVDGEAVSFEVFDGTSWVTGPVTHPYGTFTLNAANGQWSFALDSASPTLQALGEQGNVAGQAIFLVRATDGASNTAGVPVVIGIAGVNDAPTAQSVSAGMYSTAEDGAPIVINAAAVAALIADAEAADAALQLVGLSASNGTVTWDSVNGITYTPDADFNGLDSITYQVRDASGALSAPATIAVGVTAVNDPPLIISATGVGLNEDGSQVLTFANLLAVDVETAAADLTFTIDSATTKGTLYLFDGSADVPLGVGDTFTQADVDGGFVFYVANPNQVGADVFDFTVTDGGDGASAALSTSGSFGFLIQPVNDAPIITDNTLVTQLTTNEDTPTNLSLSVSDSDSASITVVLEASNGRINVNSGSGAAVITPSTQLVERVTITGSPADVNAAIGNIGFVPNENYKGPASVQVSAFDGETTSTSTVNLTITPVNDAPEALSQEPIALDEGGTAVLTLTNIFAEDVDNQSLQLTIRIDSLPSNGTLSIAGTPVTAAPASFTAVQLATGQVTFTHNGSDPGAPTGFQVTVLDPAGAASDPVTLGIVVTPVNDAPVAIDNTFPLPISENSPTFSGIIGSTLPITFATDVDSTLNPGSFTFTGTTIGGVPVATLADAGISYNPATGEFAISPQGVAAYQALDTGETANVVVSFSVSDGDKSDTGAVTFTVAGANDGPVITSLPQVGAVVEDEVPTGATAVGQVTATDVEGEAVSFEVFDGTNWVTGPITHPYGTFTLNAANGQWSFALDSASPTLQALGEQGNVAGQALFQVRATDGTSPSAATVVAIAIAGVNDKPVVTSESISATEGAPAVTGNVLTNDTNAEGPTLTVAAGTYVGQHGTLTLAGDGSYSYVVTNRSLADGQNVTDQFAYTATDAGGASASGVLTVNVTGTNTAPVLAVSAATASGTEDTTFFGLLSAATDADSSALTYALSSVTGGNAVIAPNGLVIFIPNANFNGDAVVNFSISDGALSTNGSLTISVGAVNDAPIAVADTSSGDEDTTQTITVLTNDTDADGNTLSVTAAAAGRGTVAVNNDGTLSYTPTANWSGTDTIVYTISDGAGGTATGSVTVTVNAVNDVAVAGGDAATLVEDVGVTTSSSVVSNVVTPQNTISTSGNLLANDSDVESGAATGITGLTGGTQTAADRFEVNGTLGHLVVFTNGDYVYFANNGAVGIQEIGINDSKTETFSYTNNQGQTANLVITIRGTNDGPTAVADYARIDENSAGPIGDYPIELDAPGTLGTAPNSFTIDVLANDFDIDRTDTSASMSLVAGSVAIVGTPTIVSGTAPTNTAYQGTAGTVAIDGNDIKFTPGTLFDQLDAGDVATVTISYTVQDSGGLTSPGTLTLQVTGTNDAPVLTGTTFGKTELADTTGSIALLAQTGALAFTDVDLDDNDQAVSATVTTDGVTLGAPSEIDLLGYLSLGPVTKALGSTTGSVAYDFSAPDSAFDYLGEGEQLTLTYAVTINDLNGGTDTENIVVTITGTNDRPTLTLNPGATGSLVNAGTNIDFASAQNVDANFILATDPIVTDSATLPHVTVNGVGDGIATSFFYEFTVPTGGGRVVIDIDDAWERGSAPEFDAYVEIYNASEVLIAQNGDVGTGVDAGSISFSPALPNYNEDSFIDGTLPAGTYFIKVRNEAGVAIPLNADFKVQISVAGHAVAVPDTLAGSATEDGSTPNLTDSGTITLNDADLTDAHPTVTVTALTPSVSAGSIPSGTATALASALTAGVTNTTSEDGTGAITWNFALANNLAQFLAAGEVLTAQYTITVTDDSGAANATSASQTVTVQITGTNDAPVIDTSVASDFTGTATEDTTNLAGNLADTGTIAFTDVDLTNTHTVNATLVSAVASGTAPVIPGVTSTALATSVSNASTGDGAGGVTWDFTLANSLAQFLAAGQTLTVTYDVTVTDAPTGAVDTEQVTIVITGTNDAPVVTAVDVSENVIEDADADVSGNLTGAGNVTFADVDLTDAHTPNFTFVSSTAPGSTQLGTFAVTETADMTGTGTGGNVNWTYTVANSSAAIQALNDGQTIVEKFNVVVSDGAVTDSEEVTITISGRNDAPVISSLSGDTLSYTEGAGPLALDTTAAAAIADVDSPDFSGGSLTVAITAGGVPAEDVLGIATSGSVSLGAGLAIGSVVSVGGNDVGTISAVSASSITVAFNSADATPAAAATLISAFTYDNIVENNGVDSNRGNPDPTTGVRTITWTLVDGDGTNNGGTDRYTTTSTVNVGLDLNQVVYLRNGGDSGTIVGTFDTIQEAINSGVTSNYIEARAGYTGENENIVITRPVTIDGVGAGTVLASVVIQDGALDTGETVTLKDIAVTKGATTPADANGILYQDADGTADGTLVLNNVQVSGFESNGLFVGASGGNLTNVTVNITNSSFTNNATDGATVQGIQDLQLFNFAGNATLTNVTVSNTGSAQHGIAIQGWTGSAALTGNITSPIGTIDINNVTVTGTYAKALVYINGYNDFAGLDLTGGLTLGDASTTAGWTGLYVQADSTGGAFTNAPGATSLNLSGVTAGSGATFGTSPGWTGQPVVAFAQPANADTITGSGVADAILGLGGNDTIEGNGGDDLIVGLTDGSSDTIVGGLGDDTVNLVNVLGATPVTFTITDLNNGLLGTNIGSTDDDLQIVMTTTIGAVALGQVTLDGVEDLLITLGTGGDTVVVTNGLGGTSLSTSTITVAGGTGSDIVDADQIGTDKAVKVEFTGGDGADTFRAGAGGDIFDGGDGIDTADYSGVTGGTGVTVDLSATLATPTSTNVSGGSGLDRLTNVENVIGSDFADTITGSSANNIIVGGAGDDIIRGGAGTGDQAQFIGNFAAYAITVVTTAGTPAGALVGDLVVTGPDGADVIGTDVESLYFAGSNTTIDLTRGVRVFNASNELVGTYSTIQDGLNAEAALSGTGTVQVIAANYTAPVGGAEALTINSAVKLVTDSNAGNDPNTGPARGTEVTIKSVTLASGDVTVDGFTISGSAGAAISQTGAVANVTIQNNIIAPTIGQDGVVLTENTNSTVKVNNNDINVSGDNADGVYLQGSALNIAGNDISVTSSTNGRGIVANGALTGITGNTITTAFDGIYVDGNLGNGAISGNTITGSGGTGHVGIAAGPAPTNVTIGSTNTGIPFTNFNAISGFATGIFVDNGNSSVVVREAVTTFTNISGAAIALDPTSEANGVNVVEGVLQLTGTSVSTDNLANVDAAQIGGKGYFVANATTATSALQQGLNHTGTPALMFLSADDHTAGGTVTASTGLSGLTISSPTGATAAIDLTNDASSQNINLTGTGNVSVTGSDTVNIIDASGMTGGSLTANGGLGNDSIISGSGNDTIIGGAGDDTLLGGAGDDVFIIADAADHAVGETINGGANGAAGDVIRFTSTTAGQTLTLDASTTGIEEVRASDLGGATTGTASVNINASAVTGPLSLIGNEGDNVLTGTAGADTLVGNGGNDTLTGGTGTDVYQGGTGNDTYNLGTETEAVTEGAGAGSDTVNVEATYTLAANVENLNLLGTSSINGTGNDEDNVIVGNSSSNTLTGGLGNDTLIGSGGTDIFIGGAGADDMTGGSGTDRFLIGSQADFAAGEKIAGAGGTSDEIRFTSTTAGETLTLTTNVTGVEIVALSDISGLTAGTTALNLDASLGDTDITDLYGNDGANTITGTAFSEIIQGRGGDDILIGGAGVDTVHGGSGTDTAVYSDAATVAWNGTSWVVTSTADGTETLAGIEIVDTGGLGGARTLLVGGDGFATIADAVTAAADGDTILVAKGFSYSGATINKDVTLLSSGSSGVAEITSPLTVSASGATIGGVGQGFTINGGNASAVTVVGTGVELIGNTINSAGSAANGIFVNGGTVSLAGTTITGTSGAQSGVVVAGGGSATLGNAAGNAVTGFVAGVYVAGGTGTSIATGNTLTGNGTAIWFGSGTSGNTVTTTTAEVISNGAAGAEIVDVSEGNTVTITQPYVTTNTLAFAVTGPGGVGGVNGTGYFGGTDGAIAAPDTDLAEAAASSGDGATITLNSAAGATAFGAANVAANNVTVTGADGDDTAHIFLTGAGAQNLTLGGSADIDVTGNAFGNVITDNAGTNTLNGGDGDDVIVLRADNATDTVIGGAGTNDILDLQLATGGVTAVASDLTSTTTTAVNSGGLGAFTLSSIESLIGGNFADNLTGGGVNNTLVGNGGADIVTGNDGADRIESGFNDQANDRLGGFVNVSTAGDGDIDTFAFGGLFGTDTVVDFEDGVDKLEIDVAGTGAVTVATVGANIELTVTDDAVTVGKIIIENGQANNLTIDSNDWNFV